MRVMEGQSFEVGNSGHWRKIEVDIVDTDFERLMEEWGIGPQTKRFVSLPSHARYFAMSMLAQQLLAYRVHEAGGYTATEYTHVNGQVLKKMSALKATLTKMA